MRVRDLLLALLLVCAPAPIVAQQGPPDAGARPAVRHGPIDKLVRNRARVGLTDDQVARLEAIDRRLVERNRPYVQRLAALRDQWHGRPRVRRADMTPEQRAEFEKRVEQARPLLEQIRRNNYAAMREVGEVLTPDQRARLRDMLRRHKEGHERPDADGSRRERGR